MDTEHIERFNNFKREFDEESDRGCAVLTLCVLEEALISAIERKLPPPPNSKHSTAMRNFAPKGQLSKTVVNAYMLGVLPKEHLLVFEKLISVRNKFAHNALERLTFDDLEVQAWVRDIDIGDKGVSLEGRSKFLIAAGDIFFSLKTVPVNPIEPVMKPSFEIKLVLAD